MSPGAPAELPPAPFQLPRELLSGPDVGGGYLLQLTWARPPHESAYTVHLQEAGTDAASAPAASPKALGYHRSTTPCPIGGPRCWEREFRCGPERRSMVRLLYNRFRFALTPLLDQFAGRTIPPIADALEPLLASAAKVLEASGIPWQIGGSTGAWLRGVELVPADIDLGTTAEGAERLADDLQDFLIAPFAAVDHPLPGGRVGAEAFLGTLKTGARVEWSGATPERLDAEPFSEWGGPDVWRRRQRVRWRESEVPVAPLEFDLVRAVERGRTDRTELLLAHLRRTSYDRSLFGRALAASRLSAPDQERWLGQLP